MKLVVSLIARDELGRYQPALVRQALTYADEVRVLDDGSRDGTGDALRAVDPERVLVLRNRESRWDREGEGAARQQAVDWAHAADGDWVVALDADEVVPDGLLLRDALEQTPRYLIEDADPVVYSLRMVEVWARRTPRYRGDPEPSDWQVRVDGGWAPRQCPIVWQAPPASTPAVDAWRAGWTIPRLRLACGREPEIVRYQDAIASGFDVLHLGWSDAADRRRRYDRYMEVDGGRFHGSEHLRSIMEPPRLEPYPAPRLDL